MMTWLAWVASACYLASALLLADSVRHEGARPLGARAALLCAALGVGAHLVFHGLGFRALGGPDMHFFAALSLVGLGMAGLVTVLSTWRPLATAGVLVYPIAALMLLLDVVLGTPRATDAAMTWQITLHAVLALLAYATLSIAALVAITLAIQERALRAHRVGPLLRWFPPLATVEALLFQLIGAGFVLLSATLLTGLLFVENLLAQHLAHKTVLSVAAWVVFGVLLFGRWRFGWRGRRATLWTLAGMLLLLLAFVGSKFVLEIILHRGG